MMNFTPPIPSSSLRAMSTRLQSSRAPRLSGIAKALVVISILTPNIALAADTPLTGAEFEAYAVGRMLTYFDNGTPYGAEEYLPNNRVRWAFDEDTCLEGVWFEQDDNICFVYEDDSTPQCWEFYREGENIKAIFANEDGGKEYEARASDGPLACVPPGLGV